MESGRAGDSLFMEALTSRSLRRESTAGEALGLNGADDCQRRVGPGVHESVGAVEGGVGLAVTAVAGCERGGEGEGKQQERGDVGGFHGEESGSA